jgi:hypothetical protein
MHHIACIKRQNGPFANFILLQNKPLILSYFRLSFEHVPFILCVWSCSMTNIDGYSPNKYNTGLQVKTFTYNS